MKSILLTAAFALVAAPALATTVDVSTFSKSAYDSATGAFSNTVSQNFEGMAEGNVANGFATNVGTFSTLGGIGSGGTVTKAGFANDGSLLALRDGNVFGRVSTTKTLTGDAGDDMFLDSNDTFGIGWIVGLANGSMFDRIVFTLTDAAEFGNTMTVQTLGGSTTINSGGNGVKRIIDITFGTAVSSAAIFMSHSAGGTVLVNDGFSIDDIAVNQVPLPASALLLLGGLGGVAAMRRRKS